MAPGTITVCLKRCLDVWAQSGGKAKPHCYEDVAAVCVNHIQRIPHTQRVEQPAEEYSSVKYQALRQLRRAIITIVKSAQAP